MIPHESVKRVLDAALKNGGDLAEIYLENSVNLSLVLDDGRLEQAVQGNDTGGGVRVFTAGKSQPARADSLCRSRPVRGEYDEHS